MDYRTMFVILMHLFVAVDGSANSSLSIFHHLSTKPTYNIDVYNDSVSLKCPLSCTHCPVKEKVHWKFNGTTLFLDNNVIPSSSDEIHIKSFDARKHNGYYSCVVSAGGIFLRGPDIWVQKKTIPKFTVKPQAVSLNGNAIFVCYDNSKLHSNRFVVSWFKDDTPVVLSSTVLAWDELLFVNNVSVDDMGGYHCEVLSRDGSLKSKSEPKQLTLVSESSEYSTIQYSTKKKVVLAREEFTLFCASQGQTSSVNLYKHNNQHSIMIGGGKGFIRHMTSAIKSSSYTCEANSNRIRAKEDIEIHVISLPQILNPHAIVINEKISHGHLKLECNIADVQPAATISWYKNGVKLAGETSELLEVPRLKVENTGSYQCIVSNEVGSATKLIYVSLLITDLTPRNLNVTVVSPSIFSATWKPPSNPDDSRKHHYIVSWSDPKAHTQQFSIDETEIRVNNHGVYGGAEFLLMVCFAYQPNTEVDDCVYETIVMPEGSPTKGPPLKEIVKEDKNTFKVSWSHLPAELSMGKIVRYTVYCQPFLGNQKGRKQTFLQADTTKDWLIIQLEKEGSFRVSVTAHTSKGESPESNKLTLHTYDVGRKTNLLKVKVAWVNSNDKKDSAVLSWDPLEIDELTYMRNYKIYYIAVPYKDYWKEVKSLERDTTSAVVQNLNTSSIYRFTVVNAIADRKDPLNNRKIEGGTSNAYLVPSSLSRVRVRRRSLQNVIPAPGYLRCQNDDAEDELRVIWDALPSHFNFSGYRINIFNDHHGVVAEYETSDTEVLFEHLTQSVWYGVQVHAYGQPGVTYEMSGYITCRKQTKIPSIPRDVKYSFVFDKNQDVPYLRLRWKQPLYTGGSVYSYHISYVSQETSRDPVFPFPKIQQNFIMERYEGDYLHYEAIWTDSTNSLPLRQVFSIAAINDNGVGVTYANQTHSVYFSTEHKNKKESPNKSPEVVVDIDHRIGILVGVCISLFFMLVFLVICRLKGPCKKVNKPRFLGGEGNGESTSDDYLYQEKLLENRSSRSESSGESSTQSKKKKMKPWKFFQKLQRHKKQEHGGHDEETDYDNRGIRVSYSSGSSGSRTRDCYNRCQPQCTSSCSHVESCSDQALDGQITFVTSKKI